MQFVNEGKLLLTNRPGGRSNCGRWYRLPGLGCRSQQLAILGVGIIGVGFLNSPAHVGIETLQSSPLEAGDGDRIRSIEELVEGAGWRGASAGATCRGVLGWKIPW